MAGRGKVLPTDWFYRRDWIQQKGSRRRYERQYNLVLDRKLFFHISIPIYIYIKKHSGRKKSFLVAEWLISFFSAALDEKTMSRCCATASSAYIPQGLHILWMIEWLYIWLNRVKHYRTYSDESDSLPRSVRRRWWWPTGVVSTIGSCVSQRRLVDGWQHRLLLVMLARAWMAKHSIKSQQMHLTDVSIGFQTLLFNFQETVFHWSFDGET